MATHYGIGADQVACGRNNHNLVSVRTPDGVTCKTCRSTEAHRAAVAAAVNSVPAQPVAQVAAQPAAPIAFQEWRCKLRNGDRLPRGSYFAGKQAGLKAYQVGDNDIVAHFSPEEAAVFLCKFGGYPEGEFTADDVEVVDASFLNASMQDEEGNKCPPLRFDLEAATAPTYLHGWE